MEYLYPGGLAKAITFSYDDGQVYDRRLIEIFNQAGFKGTFHLNSGNLDKDGYVQKAELPTLYAEHEIACHGVTHRHPRQICLLYTSPSPRDYAASRMPSSA